MKLLVAMCLMAAGVSAQWGESGIVHADGTLQQFTPEEAANIADLGEGGVVMKDGSHVQFDRDSAFFYLGIVPDSVPEAVKQEAAGPYTYSGIVMPDGNNVQFTAAQADDIVLVGPSGVVKADGSNLQLGQDGLPSRKKRAVLLEGPSGVLFKDGQKRPLPVGVSIVLMSEAGAVLSNGDNVQFRKKRETLTPVVGDSGYMTSSGALHQFPLGVKILIQGDTGLLLSNGQAVNLYD